MIVYGISEMYEGMSEVDIFISLPAAEREFAIREARMLRQGVQYFADIVEIEVRS